MTMYRAVYKFGVVPEGAGSALVGEDIDAKTREEAIAHVQENLSKPTFVVTLPNKIDYIVRSAAVTYVDVRPKQAAKASSYAAG